jgi:hypothetical protein
VVALEEGARHLERIDGDFCNRVSEWTIDDVTAYVAGLDNGKFSQYADGFRTNEVDGKVLLDVLNEGFPGLVNVGVASLPKRKELFAQLESLLPVNGAVVVSWKKKMEEAKVKAEAK